MPRRSEPSLGDWFDFEEDEFDLVGFQKAVDDFHFNAGHGNLGDDKPRVKKPRLARRSRPRQDTSIGKWMMDYIVDADEKYKDDGSRDGELYRRRFSFSQAQVKQVADAIRAAGVWIERPDAFGRNGHPLELLLLGTEKKL